jgi:hypothetical protein
MRRCAGKDRCETKQQATAKRAALRAEYKLRADALSVYRCDQCLGWHVGGASNSFVTRSRRSGKRPNKRMRGRV